MLCAWASDIWPNWPQELPVPTDTPPISPNFDWQMWLGPERDRPYHPSYTHALFRGWYDFGGGSIADMGNYGMWPIYMALDLPVPYSIEAQSNSSAEVIDQVSTIQPHAFSYPYANRVCFKFAALGQWQPLELYWYDGACGHSPRTSLRPRASRCPRRARCSSATRG